MTDGFSLIDLKGISEPLTKLIDSVSRGIGTLYEPTGKVRNAKAEAKAMLILAEANEKIDPLTLRALERVTHQEIRRQNNIDAIVKGATKYLPSEVSSTEVDEDWIVNFFNLGQDIGNEQMQKIWSKLLASEVAKPGSFKSRTVMAVKSLSVDEANLFTLLCEFSFTTSDGDIILPILSHDFFEYIRANGLSTTAETHLQSIGLLHSSIIWYGSTRTDGYIDLNYFSKTYLAPPEKTINNINDTDDTDDTDENFIKAFPFTEIGKDLAKIAGGTPNAEYIDMLCKGGSIFRSEE